MFRRNRESDPFTPSERFARVILHFSRYPYENSPDPEIGQVITHGDGTRELVLVPDFHLVKKPNIIYLNPEVQARVKTGTGGE